MPFQPISRRRFLQLASLGAMAPRLGAQQPSLAHESVAKLERARVLGESQVALQQPVVPLTALGAPQAVRNHFFSEVEPDIRAAGGLHEPTLARAQAEALRALSNTVACLCAAFVLTSDIRYAQRAAEHLRASFLAPATRLEPSFDQAGCAPGTAVGTPAGVVDLVPLGELARAISFLPDSNALNAAEWTGLQAWFDQAYAWLNTSRQALMARDKQDHRASAWLFLASALARFSRDEAGLEACRRLYRKPTLRNQIRSDGVFPQEVATPNPYRNTLFNFDLLAGACQLLNTPFDLLWNFELLDGVGLRIVAAYLYPLLANPEQWEYPADAVDFRALPGRRPALLFTGRAYDRPEYVALWQTLPPGPTHGPLAGSFPIRQPLLWTTRAPHGV